MFDAIQHFISADSPEFILGLANQVGMFSFRIALPMGWKGTFIIADGKLSRDILNDPTTEKPPAFYDGFRYMVGASRNIMIGCTNTHYMRSVRKGVSRAFTKAEVGRMNSIATSEVESLISKLETMESFDPELESTRLTFRIFCEAGLEYDASEEEFIAFAHNNNVMLKEMVYGV